MHVGQSIRNYTNYADYAIDRAGGIGKKSMSGSNTKSFPIGSEELEGKAAVNNAIKSLTEQQKQMLRDKYDIHNIEPTSEEHDALMKDLRDLGAISKDDYEASGGYPVLCVGPRNRSAEDAPPWDSKNVGNDMFKYYFFGQDQLMEEYGKDIAAASDFGSGDSFDAMMRMADQHLTGAQAYGRIANVLKDIFM